MSEEIKKTSVEETPTVEEETPVEVELKTYSQEDYDKAVQSASSKGKNEILKALEITSVDEAKEKLEQFAALKETESDHAVLKVKYEALLKEKAAAEDKALLAEIGIAGEEETFLALLNAEPGDDDRMTKALRVKEKLFKILQKDIPEVKIGTAKTPKTDKTLEDEFKKMQKL